MIADCVQPSETTSREVYAHSGYVYYPNRFLGGEYGAPVINRVKAAPPRKSDAELRAETKREDLRTIIAVKASQKSTSEDAVASKGAAVSSAGDTKTKKRRKIPISRLKKGSKAEETSENQEGKDSVDS